jgi:hypothetical protein
MKKMLWDSTHPLACKPPNLACDLKFIPSITLACKYWNRELDIRGRIFTKHPIPIHVHCSYKYILDWIVYLRRIFNRSVRAR